MTTPDPRHARALKPHAREVIEKMLARAEVIDQASARETDLATEFSRLSAQSDEEAARLHLIAVQLRATAKQLTEGMPC